MPQIPHLQNRDSYDIYQIGLFCVKMSYYITITSKISISISHYHFDYYCNYSDRITPVTKTTTMTVAAVLLTTMWYVDHSLFHFGGWH